MKVRLFLFFFFLHFSITSFSQSPEKPNILWISVEDISPLLDVYGDNSIKTPNISRLAREGIVFTKPRAYS